MTAADRETFAQTVARLAMALREPAPDVPMIRIFWSALSDRAIEFVVAAAEQMILEAKWFPKTSEWLERAKKIERDRIAEQRAILRKLPTPLCAACADSGWIEDAAAARIYQVQGLNRETRQAEIVPVMNTPVRRCECQKLRRLEVLGQRPMPTVPQALTDGRDDAIDPGEAKSLIAAIERRTGKRIAPLAMPKAAAGADRREFDAEEEGN